MVLKKLNGHENIIRLHKIFKAQNNKDLYFILDFMEADLHDVIRSDILEEIHKKYIVYQILNVLKYMHSGELCHGDLHPSNILIDSECHIKLTDFYLARSVAQYEDDSPSLVLDYDVTRQYRQYCAPEQLFGCIYSKAVDMWRVGCILGELITGRQIFPGVGTNNQIERILELTGKPTSEDIKSLKSSLSKQYFNHLNIPQQKSFEQFFKGQTPDALDLLKKLLVFNPNQRIDVQQALQHPYVLEFHNSVYEHSFSQPIQIPLIDFYQKKNWKNEFFQQVGLSIENNFSQYAEFPLQNPVDLKSQDQISQPDPIIQQQQNLQQQNQVVSNQQQNLLKENEQMQPQSRNDFQISQEQINQPLFTQIQQRQQQQTQSNHSQQYIQIQTQLQKQQDTNKTFSQLQQQKQNNQKFNSKQQKQNQIYKSDQYGTKNYSFQQQGGQQSSMKFQNLNKNQHTSARSNQQKNSSSKNQSLPQFEILDICTNSIDPNKNQRLTQQKNSIPIKGKNNTNQISKESRELTNTCYVIKSDQNQLKQN